MKILFITLLLFLLLGCQKPDETHTYIQHFTLDTTEWILNVDKFHTPSVTKSDIISLSMALDVNIVEDYDSLFCSVHIVTTYPSVGTHYSRYIINHTAHFDTITLTPPPDYIDLSTYTMHGRIYVLNEDKTTYLPVTATAKGLLIIVYKVKED